MDRGATGGLTPTQNSSPLPDLSCATGAAEFSQRGSIMSVMVSDKVRRLNREMRLKANLSPAKTGAKMDNAVQYLYLSDKVRFTWSGSGSTFSYVQSGVGTLSTKNTSGPKGKNAPKTDTAGTRLSYVTKDGNTVERSRSRGRSNPDGYWTTERRQDDGSWRRWVNLGSDMHEALAKAKALADSLDRGDNMGAYAQPDRPRLNDAFHEGDGTRRAIRKTRRNWDTRDGAGGKS